MVRDDVVDGAALVGRDRESYVGAMFDRIAAPYDRLNRVISLGRDRRWRAIAIEMAGVAPGSTVVDLGCGTGDFILAAIVRLGGRGRVVGIDLAANMIEIARKKIAPADGAAVELRIGNAARTALPDHVADVVTMGWVVRNLGDRPAAYAEILRILRPGGRFVCLEVSRPASLIQRVGVAAYMRAVMPVLIRCFGADREAYRYLVESSARFLGADDLAAELHTAGFSDVTWRPLMGGAMAIHRGVKPS